MGPDGGGDDLRVGGSNVSRRHSGDRKVRGSQEAQSGDRCGRFQEGQGGDNKGAGWFRELRGEVEVRCGGLGAWCDYVSDMRS